MHSGLSRLAAVSGLARLHHQAVLTLVRTKNSSDFVAVKVARVHDTPCPPLHKLVDGVG